MHKTANERCDARIREIIGFDMPAIIGPCLRKGNRTAPDPARPPKVNPIRKPFNATLITANPF
jgi:hypothetical protein